ncbi:MULTISPECIES: F0F1 ATP synthase subunit B family protein [unclassified Roseobacter]|jgi:F-type H+-transporting ATPase subunit b|uniref:F0F1 ATP synthase subunit B family protein n=1 Tax=unclassified Roseobacter TaxID=196798 RepID=UPI001E03B7BC|nr:ATP F0F1 synthase subunit B [Rhodobacterales bacterium HKCCA1058]MBF9022148.1 ATP F0F1 synthase subunit B [Rhodobacterales bacterium FZCC0069]MBF9024840.1 ATP F0F1 synthase subunit B [Rhodobacterales bacterium HKCCD6035]MBF9027175.1 ATP F0F1 synthase subunit B [Rhodobacterales bacterium FZCC0188]
MTLRYATLATSALTLIAAPAFAAGGDYGFASFFNTNYVVLIGFILFLALLFYFNVPAMILKMLDDRAETIRSELDEARNLRDEAQAVLAAYERKSREVAEQSQRIIDHAREEARLAADAAKEDLKQSIARRLKAAEEQITSAEEKATRELRNRAVDVAIAAAAKILADSTTATEANKRIDAAIAEVESRLH